MERAGKPPTPTLCIFCPSPPPPWREPPKPGVGLEKRTEAGARPWGALGGLGWGSGLKPAGSWEGAWGCPSDSSQLEAGAGL